MFNLGLGTTKRALHFTVKYATSSTSRTMITFTIKVFLFGLITTFFNFRRQHVLLPAQVDVSLTLNYPPTRLIFRINVDMAGVGGVDRAIGDEGAVDEGALGDQ
jgi:hypothetical protein